MDDYQKWRRREVKETRKVEYAFFPNRTVGQTYFVTVLMGCTIMGFAYAILKMSDKVREKRINKLRSERKLMKTYIPFENKAMLVRMTDRGILQYQREILNLPKQPTSLISDPDINYPEPKGQMTF
ncbi:putative integral membrane protein [Theileria parva strain Muguga]|uniref:Uncharacterized protein n=1 Tax=Theileria parva TaxID=5875 RepID=Q4N508_THEPA|nr:putative integral membrane protein [Theileria parva strain Muguga]EAN32765.1 putative integral membrane protein [Theileria parva strain Muguga]|eukprot:XP_765048.1 hypothetical protein [Theileria parva strain Muguga]